MSNLYPFQTVGAGFLAARRYALLADGMGLGKTVQAIAGADRIGAQRILVVAPAVATLQWAEMFRAWQRERRTVTVCPCARDVVTPVNGEVLCISHTLAADPKVLRVLCEQRWDLLILDEAHYLKSTNAQRTQAALGKAGLIHHATRTWFLTGTPMPNHPGELWPMLYVSNRTKLGYHAFIDRYCVMKGVTVKLKNGGTKPIERPDTAKNTGELRVMLSDFMLRRKTEDVFSDMPPLTLDYFSVAPGPVNIGRHFTQAQITEAHAQQTDLDRMLAGNGAVSLPADVAYGTWRRFVGHQKVQPTVELVKEYFDGGLEKIVIFAHHLGVITELEQQLRKYGVVVLDGSMPGAHRRAHANSFVTSRAKVLIGQMRAVGTALDGLQHACHHGIIVEPSPVPDENLQAAKRLARIGQKHPVVVRMLVIPGTETNLMRSITRKNEMNQQIIEAA